MLIGTEKPLITLLMSFRLENTDAISLDYRRKQQRAFGTTAIEHFDFYSSAAYTG